MNMDKQEDLGLNEKDAPEHLQVEMNKDAQEHLGFNAQGLTRAPRFK